MIQCSSSALFVCVNLFVAILSFYYVLFVFFFLFFFKFHFKSKQNLQQQQKKFKTNASAFVYLHLVSRACRLVDCDGHMLIRDSKVWRRKKILLQKFFKPFFKMILELILNANDIHRRSALHTSDRNDTAQHVSHLLKPNVVEFALEIMRLHR